MVRAHDFFFKGPVLPYGGSEGYPQGCFFLKSGEGDGMYVNIGDETSAAFIRTQMGTNEYGIVDADRSVTSVGGDTTETFNILGTRATLDGPVLASMWTSDDTDEIIRAIIATDSTVQISQSADPLVGHTYNWCVFERGILATHYIVAAGIHTTVGGGAAEEIELRGLKNTDIPFAQVRAVGASPVTIKRVRTSNNACTVTFSGDPSSDHVVNYCVIRPISAGNINMNQSHRVFAYDTASSDGGDVTEVFSQSGVRATDVVFCLPTEIPDDNDVIVSVTTSADTITLVQSADPTNGAYTYGYTVLRAI